MIKLIVALDKNGGIGLNNSLPWSLPSDLRRFKVLTENNIVVMGRLTWESLRRPSGLPNRTNVILTSQPEKIIAEGEKVKTISDIDWLTSGASKELQENADVWIIGGAHVYHAALSRGLVDYIHFTKVDDEFRCDTFFPFPITEIESETPIKIGPAFFKLTKVEKCFENPKITFNCLTKL